MDLSIVIPAYCEAKKIAVDIKNAAIFLQKYGLKGEIIIVDDGSKDDTAQAAQKAESNSNKEVSIKVIRNDHHSGKGYAICTGIKQTSGQIVMFADSGSCVPYENALEPMQWIKDGICDIAHGSRKMSGCHIFKKQSPYRRICSKLFHWFVIHDMKIPAEFTDTQCGFKIYNGDAGRHLYGECITKGFMFDIEIIMRAQKEGYRIKEFPVDWTCDRDSRLSPTRSSWHILRELLTIRKAIK